MKIDYKFNIEELAVVYKINDELHGFKNKISRLLFIGTVILTIFVLLEILKTKSFSAFSIAFVYVIVVYSLLGYGTNKKFLKKSRIKAIRKQVKSDPSLLALQSLELVDDALIYNHADVVSAINIKDIKAVRFEDGVFFIFLKESTLFCSVPSSAFISNIQKKDFFDKLKSGSIKK